MVLDVWLGHNVVAGSPRYCASSVVTSLDQDTRINLGRQTKIDAHQGVLNWTGHGNQRSLLRRNEQPDRSDDRQSKLARRFARRLVIEHHPLCCRFQDQDDG